MALALEPHWRAQARERQRQGGSGPLSPTLTKADAIDVRAEIARAAGVGAGNVTKVKQLLETATPAVRNALRRGEISIHLAVAVAPGWGQIQAERTARPIPLPARTSTTPSGTCFGNTKTNRTRSLRSNSLLHGWPDLPGAD